MRSRGICGRAWWCHWASGHWAPRGSWTERCWRKKPGSSCRRIRVMWGTVKPPFGLFTLGLFLDVSCFANASHHWRGAAAVIFCDFHVPGQFFLDSSGSGRLRWDWAILLESPGTAAAERSSGSQSELHSFRWWSQRGWELEDTSGWTQGVLKRNWNYGVLVFHLRLLMSHVGLLQTDASKMFMWGFTYKLLSIWKNLTGLVFPNKNIPTGLFACKYSPQSKKHVPGVCQLAKHSPISCLDVFLKQLISRKGLRKANLWKPTNKITLNKNPPTTHPL